MKKEVYDKTKAEGFFFRLPSEIENYVYLPKFKAEMCFLYALIADYYNTDYGYAYPTENILSLRYGKNEKTTRLHLEILAGYDLIKIIRGISGENKRYVPYKPRKLEELFALFPLARENYESRHKKADEEIRRSKQNLDEYRKRRNQR